MSWDGRVPYLDGRPVVYVGGFEPEWRANEPFEDVLVFERFVRGRSAARARFRCDHLDCFVEMFLGDFEAEVGRLDCAMLRGRWRFCKRGRNFGICRAPSDGEGS